LRGKPLALLALAYGVVAAWGLLWLARGLALRSSRSLLATVAGLILVGQAGIAWESHRTFAGAVRGEWGADPRAGILAKMRRSGSSPEVIAAMEAHVEERQAALADLTSFPAWLRHRLSNVKSFPAGSPWPAVIWSLEVLTGTVAGLWIGRRLARWTGGVADGVQRREADASESTNHGVRDEPE
jgi:hypothetical protein